MITNPVAVMFWLSLSLAFAVGVYESIRCALSVHRSRFVPKRTHIEANEGGVTIVMKGPWLSVARLEFTHATADELGRALIEAVAETRGQA